MSFTPTPNNSDGPDSPAGLTAREVNREPHLRVKKLKDIFMQTLSSANNEFPYWYTREYMLHDTEIPVVRRAMAVKAAFSHLTPVIYPGELLVMHKAAFFRGSFPMPWLSEGYYMAKEDELYQDALKRGSASADEHSKFGTGGGNVTKSFGKVVAIAGKFGMRTEEVPGLLKLAKTWVGKSVDDLGHKYEQMVPDYAVKEALMRNIICMFDSGYTLPQGREVILEASAGSKVGIAVARPVAQGVPENKVAEQFQAVLLKDLDEAGPFAVVRNNHPATTDAASYKAWADAGSRAGRPQRPGSFDAADQHARSGCRDRTQARSRPLQRGLALHRAGIPDCRADRRDDPHRARLAIPLGARRQRGQPRSRRVDVRSRVRGGRSRRTVALACAPLPGAARGRGRRRGLGPRGRLRRSRPRLRPGPGRAV